jgi:molybdopterin molybdotransferase
MKDTYKRGKGKRTLVPGFFDGEFFIHCAKFAPGMVSPLGHANAYIMIDEACEQLDSNALVNVIPTRFTFTKEIPSDLRSGV